MVGSRHGTQGHRSEGLLGFVLFFRSKLGTLFGQCCGLYFFLEGSLQKATAADSVHDLGRWARPPTLGRLEGTWLQL